MPRRTLDRRTVGGNRAGTVAVEHAGKFARIRRPCGLRRGCLRRARLRRVRATQEQVGAAGLLRRLVERHHDAHGTRGCLWRHSDPERGAGSGHADPRGKISRFRRYCDGSRRAPALGWQHRSRLQSLLDRPRNTGDAGGGQAAVELHHLSGQRKSPTPPRGRAAPARSDGRFRRSQRRGWPQ